MSKTESLPTIHLAKFYGAGAVLWSPSLAQSFKVSDWSPSDNAVYGWPLLEKGGLGRYQQLPAVGLRKRGLHEYQAAEALGRGVPAAVEGARYTRRLNQHATLYEFADGSRLQVSRSKGRGSAWFPKWKGRASDSDKSPLVGLPFRTA